MNKESIQKAIEELQYAMECDSPYIYNEAITNHALPILRELLVELEKSEKPRMTIEQIINKFVTPSSHRKIVKDVV